MEIDTDAKAPAGGAPAAPAAESKVSGLPLWSLLDQLNFNYYSLIA